MCLPLPTTVALYLELMQHFNPTKHQSMKKNKFFIIIVIIAVVMTTVSCKKNFLDEELKTARSLEYYTTDAGIQSLVTGAYHHIFCQPFTANLPLLIWPMAPMNFM